MDPPPEAMAAAVAKAAGVYLRRCLACGETSYLRQGVCLSPACKESYLSLSADEVGKRLQSWGSPAQDSKADPAQLESKRLKRLQNDDQNDQWPKRSKGRKHREWTQSFREGRHPRTGQDTTKPVRFLVDFSGQCWMMKAGTPTPDAGTPTPSGKAPEPTPESQERLRLAREAQAQTILKQGLHRAQAEAGTPTSAHPPAAKKSRGVPSGGEFVNLYRSLPVAQKNMAFDVMQKMLSDVNAAAMAPPPTAPDAPAAAVPKGTFAMAPVPIKAMPPVPLGMSYVDPETAFFIQMATQVSNMLIESLGLGPLPSVPLPKTPSIVFMPKATPVKALPAKALPPWRTTTTAEVSEIRGDTTSEEEGESSTRDP